MYIFIIFTLPWPKRLMRSYLLNEINPKNVLFFEAKILHIHSQMHLPQKLHIFIEKEDNYKTVIIFT